MADIDVSDKLGKKLLDTIYKPIEDVDKCKRLIEQGANLHYQKKFEDLSQFDKTRYDVGNPATPFAVALDKGHFNIMKLLLDNGVDIDERNGYGMTQLILRASMHDKRGLEFLLEHGADVDAKIPDGRTAFQSVFECFNGQVERGIETLKILIDNGANVNTQDNEGLTLMHRSALEGRTKVVKFLVKNGADVNIKDSQGIPPLFGAVWKKDLAMVKVLLDSGADVNIQEDGGNTALITAARLRSLRLVRYLLACGADPDIKCDQGYTAMMQPYVCKDAIRKKNADFLQAFIDGGADLNVESDDEGSVVVMAARTRQIKEMIQLIEAGADVNATDEEGNSLLMILMKAYIPAENRWFYTAAVANMQDGFDASQINFFSKKDFFITAKKLVDAGLDLNIQNDMGQTALMLAINDDSDGGFESDHYIAGLAEEIIKAGADLHLEDIFGNNALIYAAKNDYIYDMGLANLMMSLTNFEDKTYKKFYSIVTSVMNKRRW